MERQPAHNEQSMPRLLAIDDSELIQRLLRVRLKQERLEIHHTASGREGIALAESLQPAVILLDIDLPDLDGFSVLRELKSNSLTHDIPVIFISGSCETKTKVRGLDMGAIDFVSKPFDLAELRARVRSALQISMLIQMLGERAQLDALTGLWNRAYFNTRLELEVERALKLGSPLSLIFCDLDLFKNLNDEYGHPFGDQVLIGFSRLVSGNREEDIATRYGGEEFVIIVPDTFADEAQLVAERLRTLTEQLCWPEHPEVSVTCSFGVSDLERSEEPTVDALINSADKALYAAKQQGRNKVVLAPPRRPTVRCSA